MFCRLLFVCALISCALACDRNTPTTNGPKDSNTQTPKTQKTPTTQSPNKQGLSKTPPKPDASGCIPADAKPVHEAFACIHEAVPPDRIIILRSVGDLRRFTARMKHNCNPPEFDFSKYTLLAYKGTASCSLEIKDKLCKSNPLTYQVELIADGFCERAAMESRFWQVPRLGKDELVNLKRKRSRKQ